MSKIEKEVDNIRLSIYEKNKGLTNQQINERVIRDTAVIMQQYNFRRA